MKNDYIKLNLPFDKAAAASLKAGDYVLLSGDILTGRDAAHKRLFDAVQAKMPLPVSIDNAAIYYVGPCVLDGKVTSAGPTTSMRMDAYAPTLYDNGVACTIGKGDRAQSVYDAIVRNACVYFAAIGGAGALYADAILGYEVLAYPDLSAEAVHRFTVKDFPVIVAIDSVGNSIYEKQIFARV